MQHFITIRKDLDSNWELQGNSKNDLFPNKIKIECLNAFLDEATLHIFKSIRGLRAKVLLNESSLSFLGYINSCLVKLEHFLPLTFKSSQA